MPNAIRQTITNKKSIVDFERPNHWDRFLRISGVRAYHLGGSCNTCSFLFKRLGSTRISPTDVADHLASGTDLTNSSLLDAVGQLLPSGDYGIAEVLVSPTLTRPCLPDDYFCHESLDLFGLDPSFGVPDNPMTPYYRAGSATLPPDSGAYPSLPKPTPRPANPKLFFHFIVPMEPPNSLDRDRVDHYRGQLENGHLPAALGISVLDVRQPADKPWDKYDDPGYVYAEHWCLATYLLDGHHKVQAASESRLPLRLLAFLSYGESIASPEDVDAVLAVLSADQVHDDGEG